MKYTFKVFAVLTEQVSEVYSLDHEITILLLKSRYSMLAVTKLN